MGWGAPQQLSQTVVSCFWGCLSPSLQHHTEKPAGSCVPGQDSKLWLCSGSLWSRGVAWRRGRLWAADAQFWDELGPQRGWRRGVRIERGSRENH